MTLTPPACHSHCACAQYVLSSYCTVFTVFLLVAVENMCDMGPDYSKRCAGGVSALIALYNAMFIVAARRASRESLKDIGRMGKSDKRLQVLLAENGIELDANGGVKNPHRYVKLMND